MPKRAVRRRPAGPRRALLPRTQLRKTYPDLAAYLAHSGDTQEHVARMTGVSQAAISRILRGDFRPGVMIEWQLHKYCRIPLSPYTKRVLLARAARDAGKVA